MSKLVFISGATGGLGKAFAVECASRGWNVFLTDLNEQALEILASSLEHTYGVKVFYHSCDLTEMNSRSDFFEVIKSKRHKFGMLINVAGGDHEGLFMKCSRNEIQTILRLNIEATVDVIHAMLRLADPTETFRVINISSLAAFYPMPVKATYAASKRFILNFTFALREELKDMGGSATVLCPAGLPTTPHCIQSIESQGIMGQLTTMNIGKVASRTIDLALKGRAIYIPGLINQVLQKAGGLLPSPQIARLIANRWRMTHEKMAAQEEAG
ncbi:MAG: SDR family NAD(P)-dependent oxidoreductase [Anaerolineaceae bacterium]|nr:SDR family NAD(P)-dependent oxidoreductase [Anaerolineaceae bacterium]